MLKTPSPKRTPIPNEFTDDLYQIFKVQLVPVLSKLLKIIERVKTRHSVLAKVILLVNKMKTT